MIKINQGQMLKDYLSTSHIYFWQCVSCTTTLIIKPFQFFFKKAVLSDFIKALWSILLTIAILIQ